ncbi:MAG: dihydrofolate reductase family protein [Bacteroidota bacterium]
MKTIYYTASSLDGYIADANDSLEWLLQFGEPEEGHDDFANGIGAVAMGSTTYDWLLAHHVFRDPDRQHPWPYRQPTWVFSTRKLRSVPDADVRFVRGDVRPVHREMIDAVCRKNIWIVGGGDLAGQFFDHGLLDELIVTIAPVTLGDGAPLFPRRAAKPPLRLVSVRNVGDVFVEVRYEVARPDGEKRSVEV